MENDGFDGDLDVSTDVTFTSSRENVSIASSPNTKKKYKKLRNTHYTKNDSGLECKICKKPFSIKSSHSTLKNHLLSHERPSSASTSNTTALKLSKHKKPLYDRLVLNFIIHGNHPFKLVEEEHFKKLMAEINPNYSPLSSTSLKSNIQKLFQQKQPEVIEKIKMITNKISLTFDFWTSVTNKPYVVVTAHLINNGALQSFILDFDLIPYPHKAEQILHKIVEILNLYALHKRVMSITTDNEKVNVKCLQLLTLFNDDYDDVIHTRCLAHILNLVVKKGLKEVEEPISAVSKLVNLINFSAKKKQAYFEKCAELDMPQLALLKEMNIRWNSTYLMLERAYKMKAVLNYLCQNDREFRSYNIEEFMWADVKLLIDLLKPFYDATLLLSKSKYPSIYYVVPIVDVLMNRLSNTDEIDNELKKKVSGAMLNKVQEYFPLLRTEYALFSIILDPRLKNDYYSENYNGTEDPLTSMTLLFNTRYNLGNQAAEQQSDLSESSGASGVNNNIFSSIYKKRRLDNNELEKYISLPIEPEDTDVIDWWKNQQFNLPRLQKMAFDILCIPATSVPSEQSFSKAGNVINKKRNRLSNKSIKSSMCLSSWLNVFGD